VFSFDFLPPLIDAEQRDQRKSFRGGIGGSSGQKVSERGFIREFFDPVNGEEHREPRSGINLRGGIFLPTSFLLLKKKWVAIRRNTMQSKQENFTRGY